MKNKSGFTTEKRPKVGVGVYILKDGKVLFGHRIGAHGASTWSAPGGHLEFGEDIFDAARREVAEEVGIKIKNLRLGPYTNDIFASEDKHYITLAVIADYDGGEVRILEPDRCLEWRWFDWGELPSPLFLPIANLLKMGFDPFKI
ncbi:MAG: NUDIX hydrolase [Candidatus Magasanikbacteria bacterium]